MEQLPVHQPMDDATKHEWSALVDPSRHPELTTLFAAYDRGIISRETFEKNAIALALKQTEGPAEIARHLAQANRQTLEPWRVPFEAAVAQWDLALTRARTIAAPELIQQAKDQFIVKAKARALSVEEAMFGSYVCIIEDGSLARAILFHLLFEVPATIRVERHNWYMLNNYPELERSAIATQVAKLKVPLFPPIGALKTLNETILADKALLGGGPDGKKPASPGAVEHYFRPTAALRGGDYYEPIVDAEGKQISAVNMAGTEARLIHLNNEMMNIRSDIASAMQQGFSGRGSSAYGRGRGGRGSGTGRGYQPGNGGAQASSQQRQAQGTRRAGGGYRGAGWEEDMPKNE